MDLYERIKKIKERQTARPAPLEEAGSRPPEKMTEQLPGPPEQLPGPPEKMTEQLPKNKTENASVETAGWTAIHPRVWKRILTYELKPVEASPHRALGFQENGWEDYRYYDTETTGLSSGAGTYIFLFGSGRFTSEGFQVQQWFLGDFPWEPEFLMDMQDFLEEESVYVSYNGKSFDYPLLTSRYVMNGLNCPMYRQLDLLYIARRLFGEGLERCRLSDIEHHILQIRRDLDIPGSEIPDLYFQVQREADSVPSREGSGEMSPAYNKLEPVFAHHAQDIVSLARLHIRMSREFEDLERGALLPGISLRGGARQLLSAGMEDGALAILRAHSENAAELRMLAGLLKRRREYDAAFQVWEELYAKYRDYRALTEILIEYEHRRKDYPAALILIENALDEEGSQYTTKAGGISHSSDRAWRSRLQYRMERIRRKTGMD